MRLRLNISPFVTRVRSWSILAVAIPLSVVSVSFGISIAAYAQDADSEAPSSSSAVPNSQQPYNQQPFSYDPNLFNSTPIAGSSQSLLPIYYVPGMLDKSSSSFVLNQTFGHNDNVFGQPKGTPPPLNSTRGDWYRTTTVGGTASILASGQKFYVNGTYAATRYQHDDGYNNDNYSLNAGWNWVFTSRCSGTLVATDSLVQSPVNLINSFTTNNVKTLGFNETAKCQVGYHLNVILDSGSSKITNSDVTLTPNNVKVDFVRAGVEYEYTELDTLGVKITPSKYDYFDRSPIINPGLATFQNLTEYSVYYRRLFSPKLEFNGAIGEVKSESEVSGISSSNASASIWSASLRWTLTPKVYILVSARKNISPAQDIIADLQISRVDSLIVTYVYSPKLSFNAAVSQTTSKYFTAGLAPGLVQSDQNATYASLGAIYQITPFTSATARYSYTTQKYGSTGIQSGLQTTSNVFLLGLNYQR